MNKYSSLPSEGKNLQQSLIYEDLSELIKIYKKIITQIQLLVLNINQGNEYSIHTNKIKQGMKQLLAMSNKYPQSSSSFQIQKYTYHRFLSRLIETITIYKIKYQNIQKPFYGMTSFLMSLKEMEKMIRSSQEERSINKLIRCIILVFNKLIRNCEGSVRENNQIEGQVLYKSVQQQYKSSKQYKSAIQSCYQTDIETESKRNSPEKRFTIPIISFNFAQLNKRFQIFRCLDLDFNHFKTSFYESKNNQNQFYKSYFQRNSNIQTIFQAYHDDYLTRTLKKTNKVQRKKEKSLIKSLHVQQRNSESYDTIVRKDKKPFELMNRADVAKTIDQKQLKQKISNLTSQLQTQLIIEIDSNKINNQLKIKKVYMNLNKKESRKSSQKIIISKDQILKDKNLHDSSIFDKFNNEVLHRKKNNNSRFLKKINRMKTQKISGKESIVCEMMIIPATKTENFNGRYVEVNYLPKVPSFSNTKTNIMVSGLTPKFPIKNTIKKAKQKNRTQISVKRI